MSRDHRPDFISITDKTFDLSLEDSELPDEREDEEETKTQQSLTAVDSEHQSLSNNKIGYTEDFLSNIEEFTEKRESEGNYEIKISNLSTVLKNLRDSSLILGRVSGNDKCILKDLHNNSTYEEIKLEELSANIAKLSDNCELKLSFYEKNYKFLEGLYDTLARENESIKRSLQTRENELKEVRLKNKELARFKVESEIAERKISSPEVVKVEKDQLQSTIKKQEREIKEYKRFIRELMEI